jgi:hypothetical protein
MALVYHFELRKFPKAVMRFNQTGQQIGVLVVPWVQERIVEVEDFKWSPHDATLRIIEGPPIAIERISMGRGWKTAEREGQDVTERIFTEARQALGEGDTGVGATHAGRVEAMPTGGAAAPVGDQLALGVELAALLGADAPRLLAAWRAVAARAGGLAPSEGLALAERELREQPPS